MTRAPVCFVMRSAVRWRVPVSYVGIRGSGVSWVLAYKMRRMSLDKMMAPSIFASSYKYDRYLRIDAKAAVDEI